jgi:hypothetical protein
VLGELLEQLEIREAQANGFNFAEHLVRARRHDRLGGVEFEFAGTDELYGILGFG